VANTVGYPGVCADFSVSYTSAREKKSTPRRLPNTDHAER